METEINTPKPAALKVSQKPVSVWPKTLLLVLLCSLVGGVIGGVAATSYMYKSESFQKYSNVKSLNVQSQRISITEDSAVINTVKKTSPSVVSIVISKDLNKISGFGSNFSNQDPFYNFFGRYSEQKKSNSPNIQQIGAGSGFFVSNDGLIITNKHVVEDLQASYTVLTSDGLKYEAKVLTRDPINDLAILKIEIKNSLFLQLADSEHLQIGQRVIAIGNSLGQYQNTVTSGIVSGIGRKITAGGLDGQEELEGVIQTDAAINPGNSGGPLLNLEGGVIGINTAIDQQGQLVGFAIPSSDVARALESYKANGKISRAFLGVRYIVLSKQLSGQENLPRDYGALVIRGSAFSDFAVIPGSPADKAGIVENDIILEVDGVKVEVENNIAKLLKNSKVGDTVRVKVYHRGEEKTVSIILGEAK